MALRGYRMSDVDWTLERLASRWIRCVWRTPGCAPGRDSRRCAGDRPGSEPDLRRRRDAPPRPAHRRAGAASLEKHRVIVGADPPSAWTASAQTVVATTPNVMTPPGHPCRQRRPGRLRPLVDGRRSGEPSRSRGQHGRRPAASPAGPAAAVRRPGGGTRGGPMIGRGVGTVEVAASVERCSRRWSTCRRRTGGWWRRRLFPWRASVAVPEVGSRIAALTGFAGIGVLDTMTVTVYDPPHRWETEHTGGASRASASSGWSPSSTRVRVITWAEEVELPVGYWAPRFDGRQAAGPVGSGLSASAGWPGVWRTAVCCSIRLRAASASSTRTHAGSPRSNARGGDRAIGSGAGGPTPRPSTSPTTTTSGA